MLPVLRLLINTSRADRGIHHWPGVPPSFSSPSSLPLPPLAYKLAGVAGVNQRGIMSQRPQQEVCLMKSLVIYVWGRLGGYNLEPTHSGFQEVDPLEQKEKEDRQLGRRACRLLPANSLAHRSHTITNPGYRHCLTKGMRTTLWALCLLCRAGPFSPRFFSSAPI